MRFGIACALAICAVVTSAHAQDTQLAGTVRDDSGTALPGVTVELRPASGSAHETVTDGDGRFEFDRLAAGSYQLTFTLINFATARRAVVLSPDAPVRADAVLHFAVNADVTVTAKRTFTNLADVEHPEENLVGIAQAASQGAVVAKQIEQRPLMRDGEVLETDTIGGQVRNDDISTVALYHTEARTRLETRGQAAVLETSGGLSAQNEMEWTPGCGRWPASASTHHDFASTTRWRQRTAARHPPGC